MNRRQHLSASVGLGLGLFGLGAATKTANLKPDNLKPDHLTTSPLLWRERHLIGFGTTLWLRAAHTNEASLQAALAAAVRAIRHVESQMSLFDTSSALVQLNERGVLHKPDPHLVKVLTLSQHIARASNGAFDVTMQPLWQAWSGSQAGTALPSAQAVARAAGQVNWQALEVSADRIQLTRPHMAVSLNGIAQGYAADLVKATLAQHGVQHALIDAGEWQPMGESPSRAPWTLALESDPRIPPIPQKIPNIISDGRAIATSSDRHTAFSADRQHHHIVNPKNGYSPTHWSQVSVVAPSAALADGLTKVMFMASKAEALALAKRWRVDVLLVDKRGRWVASDGMLLGAG
jgi:FAD:protein FMN transferase